MQHTKQPTEITVIFKGNPALGGAYSPNQFEAGEVVEIENRRYLVSRTPLGCLKGQSLVRFSSATKMITVLSASEVRWGTSASGLGRVYYQTLSVKAQA